MPLIAVCHLVATMSRCPREAIWHSKDNNSNSHLLLIKATLECRHLLLRRLRALAPDKPAGMLTHLRAHSLLEVEVTCHQGPKQMLR